MDQKVIGFAINLAALLFAVSFHESAHAWMALRFGDTTARDLGRISMNPLRHIDPFGSVLLPILLYFTSGLLFGYAKPTPVNLANTRNPRAADFAISAAGPGSNLLLAALGTVVLFLIRHIPAVSTITTPLWEVFRAFVLVNLSLAVFNFIPIPPLDGSHVLASLLGPPAQRFFAAIAPFGFLILILLSSSRLLGAVMMPVFRFFLEIINWVLR